MFPLKDNVPARHPPVVNWAIIGVNALVFLIELSLPTDALEYVFWHFGVVPARYAGELAESSLPGAAIWSPLTSMFLHGGWFHVIANMWMLWVFGDNVEDRLGRVRFVIFYLACGIAAAATHAVFAADSRVPTIGASGAIAGVLGGYVLLYPRARVLTLVPLFFLPVFVELTALVFIGVWFIGQVMSATWTLMAPERGAGIAWWAHVGGFVAGLLLVKPLCCRERLR